MVIQELGYEYFFYLFYQSFIGFDLLLPKMLFYSDVKPIYVLKILSSFHQTLEYDQK